MSAQSKLSRRSLLKVGIGALGAASLAACQAATPQVVEQVVEKEVTVIVEGTPQVVKETVVVEVPASAEPVEIRIAFYVMGDSWMANAMEASNDFESKNPNIKTAWEWRPGGEYWTKLQTEFAGGVAPDVTVNQMNWVIPGAARGMWVDLKPYIERDGFDMSQYFYPMDKEWAWQGGLYGGLLYAGGQTLMINKNLLAEAGLEMPTADWTWDDLLAYAKAMTIKEKNQYGLSGATGAPCSSSWSASFIHSNGGSTLNDDYNKCTLTEAPAVEAVQWLYDRMFVDEVMPTPASLTGQENPWLTGKVGMAFNGTWYESQTRDADLFEWDFAPMPKHPVTGLKSVAAGSNTWSILANTRNREESWKFVEFMMGVDGQTWMMKYGIPGITSVVESQAYRDLHAPQDITIVTGDISCCAHDYYPTADCDEWWAVCDQEWSPIWSGELSVEEALNNACIAIDEVFARRPEYYEK